MSDPLTSYIVDEGCVELSSGDGNYATLEDCEAVCQTSGIEEKELPSILFYPNPMTSGETITINPTEKVVLYTMHGQKVFEKELKNNFFLLSYHILKMAFICLRQMKKSEKF